MAVMTYQIWIDKDGRPLDTSKTQQDDDRRHCLVGIQALAKSRGIQRHNEFVNEHIAGELARSLRLPVAEGVFIKKDKDRWHASFNFNSWSPERLPKLLPIWITRIADLKPNEAAGIVAFDIWVCNEDRGPTNIAWNDQEAELYIFDQGESLLQGPNPRQRLNQIYQSHELGIGNHCLLGAIRDLTSLSPWFSKIREIPAGFIRTLISEAECLGLRKSDGQFLEEFLLERRTHLDKLIYENAAEFKSVGLQFDEYNPPPFRHKSRRIKSDSLLMKHVKFCRTCSSKCRNVLRGHK